MFGLKKKGREKARSFQNTLREQLSPHMARLGDRLRLRSRIRWANMWGRRHPKRLMVYYMTFASCLLVFSIIFDFSRKPKKSDDSLGLDNIPSMSHRIQSLSNTEIQNDRIKRELSQLGQKGMVIYNELDSLLKLPVKTHEDSVRILYDYRILNDTFNKHGHEHQKD